MCAFSVVLPGTRKIHAQSPNKNAPISPLPRLGPGCLSPKSKSLPKNDQNYLCKGIANFSPDKTLTNHSKIIWKGGVMRCQRVGCKGRGGGGRMDSQRPLSSFTVLETRSRTHLFAANRFKIEFWREIFAPFLFLHCYVAELLRSTLYLFLMNHVRTMKAIGAHA